MNSKERLVINLFDILDQMELEAILGKPGEARDTAIGPLRTVCDLNDQAGPGQHKHSCLCGTVWKHSDALPRLTSQAEFDEAHSCPHCHTRGILDKVYP